MIVPSRTTQLSCVLAGTSVVNALLTATTRLVTLERLPSLKRRRTISWPTSPKFSGRTNLPPRLDFPGQGFATPGPKKSLPTNPHNPHGQQLPVVHRSALPTLPPPIPPPPTTTASSFVGDTTAPSPQPSPPGSLPMMNARHPPPPVLPSLFDPRECCMPTNS